MFLIGGIRWGNIPFAVAFPRRISPWVRNRIFLTLFVGVSKTLGIEKTHIFKQFFGKPAFARHLSPGMSLDMENPCFSTSGWTPKRVHEFVVHSNKNNNSSNNNNDDDINNNNNNIRGLYSP